MSMGSSRGMVVEKIADTPSSRFRERPSDKQSQKTQEARHGKRASSTTQGVLLNGDCSALHPVRQQSGIVECDGIDFLCAAKGSGIERHRQSHRHNTG